MVVVILGLVLTVRVIGWNWARGYVEHQVTHATGRDFTIAGDLDVDLSLHPLIRAEDIRVGNAPWGRFPNIAEIGVLQLRIDLSKLIQGRVVIPELSIRKPVAHLAVSASGKPNWRLAPETSGQGGALPVVHRLAIEDGTVTYRDYSSGMDLMFGIARIEGYTDTTRNEIALGGRGRLGQQPWRLALRAGSLQALRAVDKPYPVDLALALADTRANIEGTLTKPLRLQGVDLSLSIEGLNLSVLSPFLAGPRPRLPRHKIEGQLTRAGDIWRLKNLRATVGESNLQGEIAVDTRGERPTIKAELTSSLLRYDDFAGLAPPSRKPQPLDLSVLRNVDAIVNFNGDKILTPAVALRDARIAARLDNGRLRVEPMNFAVGGGRVRAQAVLDASQQPFEAYAEADIQQVRLSKVDDRAAAIEGLEGVVAGRIAVRATGATQAQMTNAAHANLLSFLDSLAIDDTQLSYRVPGSDTRLQVTVDTRTVAGQLEIAGGGTWRGEDFELAIQGYPLLELTSVETARPYAIAGTASGAAVDVRVDGTLNQPLSLEGIDLEFSARGSGTERLSTALRGSLPDIAAYELEGRLIHQDTRWKIADLEAWIGDSDLAGDVAVDTAGEKPYIKADLFSHRLDPDDFAAPSGAPDDTPAKAQNSGQTARSPLNLMALQRLEADVHLEAEKIITPNLPLESVAVDVALHDRRLIVEPFTLGIGGGTLRGTLVLDSTVPVSGALTADVEQIDIQDMLEPLELDATFGVLAGHAELTFTGATAEQIAVREQTLLSTIHSFSIEDTLFNYREPESRTDIELTLATTTTANGSEPIRARGDGQYQGEPFDLNISAGSPLRLLDQQNAYPIDASIVSAKTKARLEGNITQPLKLRGLSLSLALKGPNPNRLQEFLGLPLPSLPPYEVEGELLREGDIWRFEDFQGSTGTSDLAGDLSLTTAGERMFLRADLVSDTLDFVQILGPAQPVRNGPVIPDTTIDVSPLRALDAEISYRATRIYAPGGTFARVSTEILLNEGHLTLEPLKFDYLGGTFHSRIEVAANEKPVHTLLDTRLHKLSLNEILAKVGVADQATGVISGRISLEGDGRSPADFAASADGSVWLVARDGRINEMLIEKAGLGLIETLSLIDDAEGSESASTCTVEGPWCRGESEQAEPDVPNARKQSDSVNVRCLVADFRARNGVLAAQTLIMDTADTKVVGSGTIALGSESVDLTLLPHAKDFSLLAGQAPLHIQGTFRDLNVEVSKARIAFSLLTPIELGTADPADCEQLIQAVRQP